MSIILTCNVTGKTVKWSNQSIIDAKIKEYGSLEAFQKAYVSRGAKRTTTSTTPATTTTPAKVKSGLIVPRDGDADSAMRAILNEGVALGRMSKEEYHRMMEEAGVERATYNIYKGE